MAVLQYKCPNCGAPLEFKADSQNFGCEYCMSSFSEQEIKDICRENESTDLSQNEVSPTEQREFANQTNLYTCDSCGAEIIADENTAASFCCYCHNPVVLSGRLSGDYRPDKVLPFKIDKDTAISKFKKWSGAKFFVPKEFKSEQQLEKMTGLYVPFWLADCNMETYADGIGKEIHTWSDSDYNYTRTKEYEFVRKAKIKFKGLPADGASKIPDELMQTIEPFDYSGMKDFSMSYLSGFLAEKYDVDKAGVFPTIKGRAETGAKKFIDDSLQYTSVSYHKRDYRVMGTEWKYALMPVWFMNFNYNGESYSFAMNGQSGKFAGRLPLNKTKLAFCSLLITAVIIILGIIGGALL